MATTAATAPPTAAPAAPGGGGDGGSGSGVSDGGGNGDGDGCGGRGGGGGSLERPLVKQKVWAWEKEAGEVFADTQHTPPQAEPPPGGEARQAGEIANPLLQGRVGPKAATGGMATAAAPDLTNWFEEKSPGFLLDVWRRRKCHFNAATREFTSLDDEGVVKGRGTIVAVCDVPDRRGKRRNRFRIKIDWHPDFSGEPWLDVCAPDAATKAAVEDALTGNVASNGNHTTFGIVGSVWVHPMLEAAGRADVALATLLTDTYSKKYFKRKKLQ